MCRVNPWMLGRAAKFPALFRFYACCPRDMDEGKRSFVRCFTMKASLALHHLLYKSYPRLRSHLAGSAVTPKTLDLKTGTLTACFAAWRAGARDLLAFLQDNFQYPPVLGAPRT